MRIGKSDTFNESAVADRGASFRQIQQRYEPHPGTLRAIEIVENSPTYSKRPQPADHASRDRGNKRKYSEGCKEGTEGEIKWRSEGRRHYANIYRASRGKGRDRAIAGMSCSNVNLF